MMPDEDYALPPGPCDVKREGDDVTMVAADYMVWHATAVARMLAGEGVEVEMVGVCTRSPLDEDAIGLSARKTGRVVVAAEPCRSHGPTGEWGMVVLEQAFDYLQAPVARAAGREATS